MNLQPSHQVRLSDFPKHTEFHALSRWKAGVVYEPYLLFLMVSLGRHTRAAHIRDIGTWGWHSEKPFEAHRGRLETFLYMNSVYACKSGLDLGPTIDCRSIQSPR